MKITKNTGKAKWLNAWARRPAQFILKLMVFLAVFSISLSQSKSRAGKEVNIETRLKTTPLLSTRPMSRPIVKLINTSTISPTTVVTELEQIAPKEYRIARRIAVYLSGWSLPAFSWR